MLPATVTWARCPWHPAFLLLIFLLSAVCLSEVRIFQFHMSFHRFGFVWYSGFLSVSPYFFPVESRKPPHRPTAAQTGSLWARASSGNLKIGHRGNTGFTQGSRIPLHFVICFRPRGQGRKERKGRKNYGPNSCVTCGTCVTGSAYCTSTNRCPLLR